MTMFFQKGPVVDYASAKASDTTMYGEFFRGMLSEGIYLAPSQFEATFIGLAHSDSDIDEAIRANYESLRACR